MATIRSISIFAANASAFRLRWNWAALAAVNGSKTAKYAVDPSLRARFTRDAMSSSYAPSAQTTQDQPV